LNFYQSNGKAFWKTLFYSAVVWFLHFNVWKCVSNAFLFYRKVNSCDVKKSISSGTNLIFYRVTYFQRKIDRHFSGPNLGVQRARENSAIEMELTNGELQSNRFVWCHQYNQNTGKLSQQYHKHITKYPSGWGKGRGKLYKFLGISNSNYKYKESIKVGVQKLWCSTVTWGNLTRRGNLIVRGCINFRYKKVWILE